MKKYIVTGGAGFIGSHLTETLLGEGGEVVVIDDFSTGFSSNLAPHENLTVVECDVSCWHSLVEKINHFKGAEGVFHLAAMARIQPAIQNPRRTHEINVNGTLNILELCRLLDIPKVIFSSSSSVYGLKNAPPLKEDMSVDPLNIYAASKYIGEQYMKNWSATYGINTLSLRYFNVYGPRSPLEGQYAPVLGLFFRQLIKGNKGMTIVGDGKQKRSHTFVGDVVRANIAAMKKVGQKISGEVLNVGTSKSYTILELAKMVEDAMKTKRDLVYLPPRTGEARDSLGDCSKAERLIGWKADLDLLKGVTVMRNHYLDTLK